MQVKIPFDKIGDQAGKVMKNIPQYVSKVSQAATPIIKQVSETAAPVVAKIKEHPVATIVGGLGSLSIVDDVYQRIKLHSVKKDAKEMENKTAKVLQKQDAEIHTLKLAADRANELSDTNEQLRNVIEDLTGVSSDAKEEVLEDGATDQ